MGITYGRLLYYHCFSEGNVDRKTSTLDYNNSMVYERFDYPFTDEVGIPDLNLPPITIDGRHRPHKIAHYTPDMLPYAISVDSENYFSTLTTPSDSQDLPTFF